MNRRSEQDAEALEDVVYLRKFILNKAPAEDRRTIFTSDTVAHASIYVGNQYCTVEEMTDAVAFCYKEFPYYTLISIVLYSPYCPVQYSQLRR